MSNELQKDEIRLYQRVCEKHDFVTVVQTTTRDGKEIDRKEWMQCKNCCVTIPIPQQQKLTRYGQ